MLTNHVGVSAGTPQVVPVTQLVAEADALVVAGKKEKARDRLLAAWDASSGETKAGIEGKLGGLNVELVRQPWPIEEKTDYVVQEGDSIKAIAQKFGTTVEVIVEGNQLKRPDVIKPGDRLRVFSGKLAVVVNKTRNDLLVTCNGRFFKRYRVGTGKYDRTPVGTFAVCERIKEPVWWRADGKTIPFGDKDNILGTRWLALKATGGTPAVKGYGIHGTWDPESIGKAESAGCIRLVNSDVEELLGLIPVGTEVVIEE
jgi:lipoprotein-anchoring transpeptidase ErfK/SrfK